MSPFLPLIERVAIGFDQLPFWGGECRVWGQRMRASTFERWLYLRMHRLGYMGRKEHNSLIRYIRPGMTIVDVGANLGLYTVLFSRLVGPNGRIVAFEPDAELFAQLQRNCALNRCANVFAHNLALGRRAARLVLQKMILNSGDNHLGAGGTRAFRRTVETQVVALGEYSRDLRPDLVKIDVQGWELEVLLGMEDLLIANPQTELYFEFWPEGFRRAGCTPGQIVEFLRKLDFTLYLAGTSEPLTDSVVATLSARLGRMKHADLFASRRLPAATKA